MITIEMLNQSESLSGLTDAQKLAITVLSKNDEASVIGTKIGALHGQYDSDILSISGISKIDGEKTYDYLKRVLNDYKTKLDGSKTLSAQLEASKKKVTELETKLAAGGSDEPIGMVILKTVLFFVASGCFGFLLYKLFSWIDKRWPHRRRIVILSIVFCFALSYVAEKVFGVAEITGAFIAGVILCNIEDSEYVDRRVNIGSYMFFGPLFFASIGLKTDLSSMTFGLLAFSGLFIVGAIAGKIVGCGFAAKVTKHTWKESLIAGVGMMTRGEVALVVTQKGLDSGLVKPEYFAPVILLIIVSSVITPILLKLLFSDKKQKEEVS